ncbi:MAG: trigger factor [Armatimonadetes bacterium]|nr:trigger factor [Armatimonadota bacterium]
MLVKQEELNPCEVALHIDIEVEKVSAAIDKAYIDAGKSVNIPGFRKGKAPKAILQQFLDEDRVKEHAADILLQAAYAEALKESNLEPYAPADVEITKFEIGEPLKFRAKVQLAPKIEIGEYKGIKAERKSAVITAKEVDAELESIRKRHAQYPEADRPAQNGDVVRIETKTESNPNEEMKSSVAKIGDNLPDFDKGLVGMTVGEEKVVEINYPKDYANEAIGGKTVPVRIKMTEIREENLPELNDEWVASIFGGGQLEEGQAAEVRPDVVSTVKELKVKIKEAMIKASEEVADDEVRNKIVHKIIEGSQVHFPDVMVEEMVNERVEEVVEGLKKRKVTLEDYLKYKGSTYKELREEFAVEARHDLKTRLVLREIVDKENLNVVENDIEAELAIMAESNQVPVETIRAYVEKTGSMPSVNNRILMKKVMDFLVQSSNINNIGK